MGKTAVRVGRGALVILYLIFRIYLVREIWFVSGKRQGILKSDVCGKHVNTSLHGMSFFQYIFKYSLCIMYKKKKFYV